MNQSSDVGRILIVDDDELFRSAQKRILRQIEIRPGMTTQCLEAGSGDEAMNLLRETAVDCILLDHDMPGGNGLFWLQRILELADNPAVVMLTGHGSEQLAVTAMKNGAMDYLVKGAMTSDEINRAILNAIEKVELRKTIKVQQEQLLDAERQRVMIDSLGTACHHIGQPATVISTCLQLMKARKTDAEMKEMINCCQQASDSMTEILQKLQQICLYRPVPYLTASEGQTDNIDTIIAV